MAKIEKFPQEIYVTIEEDGDDEYLSAAWPASEPGDAITSPDKQRVGTYKLVKVQEGRLEPVFTIEVSQ